MKEKIVVLEGPSPLRGGLDAAEVLKEEKKGVFVNMRSGETSGKPKKVKNESDHC
jgi:hypothetical protein